MKILINYDLLDEIKRAQEPFTIVKEIKNSPSLYIKSWAVGTGIGLIYNTNLLGISLYSLSVAVAVDVVLSGIGYHLIGDYYKSKAFRNLNQLSLDFNKLSVNTNYDLLLDSQWYQSNYKVELSSHNIPYLLENKYILVPSYNQLGEVINTPVLQEHAIGSKDYLLSVSSPSNERSYVYMKD